MDCQQILKAANAHDKGYVTLSQENIDALIRAGYVFSGGSGPAVGDGLLLETGTDFVLLETGDFLLLE